VLQVVLEVQLEQLEMVVEQILHHLVEVVVNFFLCVEKNIKTIMVSGKL